MTIPGRGAAAPGRNRPPANSDAVTDGSTSETSMPSSASSLPATEFADIHSGIQHGHAAPLRAALDRAVLSGEIPSTTNRDAIAAALLGPLFYRRWFSREQIDAEFVDLVVRNAVAGLRRDSPRPERQISQ
jgi:hypothetical protein